MVQGLIGNSLETRVARLQELMRVASKKDAKAFYDQFLMSWIYHDSLLEGVVYSPDELRGALSNEITNDTSLIPVYDEIRNHRTAIERIYKEAEEHGSDPLELDLIKELFAILAPEELEGKAPKFRKDSPPHRPYFHDVLAPDKIAGQMRNLIQWINSSETQRTMHPVRLASKAHFDMLHIYPFTKQNGKVSRLMLNLILMRSGYPPVVVHSTERQRYYDVLRISDDATAQLVSEALGSNVETAVKYFESVMS